MKLKVTFVCILFVLTFRIARAQHTYTDDKKGITYVNSIDGKLSFLPDSIRVELPDRKAVIIFKCKNISKELSFIQEFPDRLKEWVAQLALSSPSTTTSYKVTIRLNQSNDSEIQLVQNSEPATLLRIHDKTVTELLPPGWELTIHLKTMVIYVYAQSFKDLEALPQQSLQPIQESIKKYIEMEPLHRKTLSSRFVLQGEKITYQDNKRQIAGDFLEINMTGGLGFLGDKIYPELNPFVNLRFGDRYHRKDYKISFSYNNMFFTERRPDGGFVTRPNSFVTVAWCKNLIFKKGDASWIGLGAGLLVRRSGDYFKGQTAKFFISKDIGHFNLAPELYLTDDYKKALLGFRLNYTF